MIFNNSHYPSTTEKDIQAIFDLIRTCPYISDNSDYKEKANATKIYFEGDNSDVNAYATVRGENLYKIVMFAGICNMFKLSSLIIAEFEYSKNTQFLENSVKWISNKIISNGGTFTIEDYNEGANLLSKPNNNIYKEAKSFLAGTILSVIGHEQGHICLSHVLRGDTGDANSRNDERSADLFSCSVAESTPFGRYSVLGNLIFEIIFTWLSESTDRAESTHPHSRERLYNWINSHREYLASFGITKDSIDQVLPKAK